MISKIKSVVALSYVEIPSTSGH